MKKFSSFVMFLCLPLFFSAVHMTGEERATAQPHETQSDEAAALKEPFCRMTPGERMSTGIHKLTPSEQEALITWWSHQKSTSHQHSISKEVTISSISNADRSMALSDGSKISFSKSVYKKVARWVVGDTLGFGDSGKRGSVTIYHMASGQKVKAKREQAPKQAAPSDQKK